jgi:hypothetical protein
MKFLGGLSAVALLALAPAVASATTVVVDATTDIFLASQPNGSTATGFFGTDTAPANSPVLIGVGGGDILTFSAAGSTSVDGSCFAGPDGGCYADESGFSPSPASGTYKGPSDALIGVFLDNSVTAVDSGPPSLDFTKASNVSRLHQKPGLNQIFFIGDGLTGTGAGSVQQITAPTGATRLYLAVADSYGSSDGNPGDLRVDYDISPAAAVPEPASWAMMLMGFLGLGATLRASRRRQGAAVV